MSAQEQVSKLQGLLERIQKNASRPRASAPLATAPATFAPPPPATFAPPPILAAPLAATPFVAPAASFDAVDELLGASPEQSPMPVDVDVPLDSVPPVAEISQSQAPDADPIPLVSLSTSQPVPPPIDDAFGLDSEVSEVRVTTVTREPAGEVTVAAIEAEAEPMGPEELSEDDLVEVTEGTPPPADVDIDFEDEPEQAPASSQRKVASSMDEALAAAAEQLEAEREVPLKTPPPESGPQEAPGPMGMAAPAAPDVDALLGGELDIPTRADAGLAARGPTTEQLGQTIDLEEARGPSLELAEHRVSTPAPPAIEELEAPLPGPTMVGGYDEHLQPPPEARDDLEAHRRRQDDDIPPPPESLAQYPSVQPGAPPAEIVPIFQASAGPEVIARSVVAGSPESFGTVRETFRPSSFVELLDASLNLNGQ